MIDETRLLSGRGVEREETAEAGVAATGARSPLPARLLAAWWPPLVFLVALIAIWELVAPRGWILNPVLLPAPHEIVTAGWRLVTSSFFMENFTRTAYEIAAGFVIAVALGLIVGTLFAIVPLLRQVMYPYIIVFQALPKIVLVPIFLVLFGYGANSKIITAVAIAFFPVFMNTMIGLSLVEEDGLKLMRSLTANRWQVFTKLRVPNALPLTFAGIKTSATLAMTGAIAAEFLAGTDLGIGRLIAISSFQLQMDTVFALVFLIAIMAFLLFFAVEWLGERIVFWGEDQEQML